MSNDRLVADEYSNLHRLGQDLARGAQGVVFRTMDADLAIKKPYDAEGNPDENADLRERFQNIRLLPLPPRIPISLPLAILRDESGYVMRLLNGMKPLHQVFNMNQQAMEHGRRQCPKWLERVREEKARLRLLHYASSGSTRRRLYVLSKCACILARLHSVGLVYGDISPKNVFVGDGDSPEVWLIDADNLRFEMREGGNVVLTQHYGAPEIVQKRDWSRPRTDCWAFAALAFETLSLCHPFIGRKVLEPDNDQGGWDSEPRADGEPSDWDGKAYAGYLAFIDDEDDDTNAAVLGNGLPRELVATPELRRLFQETFAAGRTQPHRRPSMAFWALELARAFDQSLNCTNCKMSYFWKAHAACPYCSSPRPVFACAKTARWEVCIPSKDTEFALPHRLFYPFSFEKNDDAEYDVSLDFDLKTTQAVRGANPFPPELSIEFVEVVK